MRAGRQGIAVSGAVGVLLAALIYFLAPRGQLLQRFPTIPDWAELALFILLLGISLAELPVMFVGIRTFGRGGMNRYLIYSINVVYVAFAAVYAAILLLLFGDSAFTALLAGLSLIRWATDWWIR